MLHSGHRMSQCLGGCGFFASQGDYCSVCARQFIGATSPVSAASARSQGRAAPTVRKWSQSFSLTDDPWIAACFGAAGDDLEPVQRYLDTGGAVDRVTAGDDCKKLGALGMWVQSQSTLVDIALERDSGNVLMLLLGESVASAPTPSLVRRHISTIATDLTASLRSTSFREAFGDLDAPALPDAVRVWPTPSPAMGPVILSLCAMLPMPLWLCLRLCYVPHPEGPVAAFLRQGYVVPTLFLKFLTSFLDRTLPSSFLKS